MPVFGKTSRERLNTCHPDLIKICNFVIEYLDFSVFCGFRNKAAQQEAFEDGLSQVQWPNSKHNKIPAMAVDAGQYFPELRNTDWNDKVAFGVLAGYMKLAAEILYERGEISHKIRWGGDWDGDNRTSDETFQDLPHFELVKP